MVSTRPIEVFAAAVVIWQLRAGTRTRQRPALRANPVLVAQSTQTWISNALSVTVLVGLGLNAVLGWWWADPTVALVVAALAASSGREAWREAGEAAPDAG